MSFAAFRMIAGLFAAALLSGCETLSEEDCLQMDWAERGEQRGRQGRYPTPISYYENVCKQYGVIPDEAAYMAAYNRALAAFCTLENGYARGSEGSSHADGCRRKFGGEYDYGYDVGNALRELDYWSGQWNATMSSKRSEVQSLKQELNSKQWALQSDMFASEEERKERQEAIDDVRERRDQLIDEINHAVKETSSAIRSFRLIANDFRRSKLDRSIQMEVDQMNTNLMRVESAMQMELQMLNL